MYDEFKELDAEIVALSIDTAEDAARMLEIHGLEYPLAYDTTTEVTRAWGVFDLLDDGVAAPATFIFRSDGRLGAWRIGEDIADRPTAAEVLRVLRQLQARDEEPPPAASAQATPARPVATPITAPASAAIPAPAPEPTTTVLPNRSPTPEPTTVPEPARMPSPAPSVSEPASPDGSPDGLGPGVHDFTLPRAAGEPVQLSSFQGEKNVVLVFYRAFW